MRIVPTPPLPEWGLNAGGFEELFLEGRLDGKGVVNFWRGEVSGFYIQQL